MNSTTSDYISRRIVGREGILYHITLIVTSNPINRNPYIWAQFIAYILYLLYTLRPIGKFGLIALKSELHTVRTPGNVSKNTLKSVTFY